MNKDKAFDELYKLALNCAEFAQGGCYRQCDQCGYNVFRYTNERDATLIKSNAYADFNRRLQLRQEIDSNDKARAIGDIIVSAIPIIVLLIIIFGIKSCIGL